MVSAELLRARIEPARVTPGLRLLSARDLLVPFFDRLAAGQFQYDWARASAADYSD